MTGWIILGFYLLGYVLMWRTIVWALVTDDYYGRSTRKIEGIDVVAAVFIGSFFTLFWPVVLAGLAVRYVYVARGLDVSRVLMPRSVKRVRDLDEREQRIKELERELGVE